ncbi:hypothetical protein [Streptomyces hyaluromycini]|uniref:hypothetical protein n=1 Tax=Streptomyces hyaluromycini TaxID=1377993 RepID=UPI000B5CA8BC|nr:hypothetical protein [Streptomyces hyaluromycini]
MQSPLPRRPKGPSAIAAASASRTTPGPGPGPEDDSASRQQTGPTEPPMSAAAAAFAAESTATPQDTAVPQDMAAPQDAAVAAGPARVGGERTENGSGRSRRATGTPPGRTGDRAAEAAAGPGTETAPRPPAGGATRRRLPRAVLLTGVSVVVAALICGAFLISRAGDDDTRSPDSASGAMPGTAGDGGSYDGTPSLLGPPPPSMSRSASPSTAPSPSADATHASSGSPATKAAKGGSAAQPTSAPSVAAAAAADGGRTQVKSGGSDDGSSSCTSAAGSGALTDYSVCVSSGTVTFQVTFHTSQSYYHVFFDTDGNTATGYQLPYPSPSALGADYMIENGGLYRSRSTDWSWTQTATRPKRTVDGPTRTWTLPLSRIGSPTGTQRVEFNAGSDYTPVIAFSPK